MPDQKILAQKQYKSRYIEINANLHSINGGAPYFSFTYWDDSEGGCGGYLPENVANVYMPALLPFLPLHLSDENGVPMHAVENGKYWLGLTDYPEEKNLEKAAKHFRDSVEMMEEILRRYEEGEVNIVSEYVAGKKEDWKREAEACIDYLNS